jgi:hypothetical protein
MHERMDPPFSKNILKKHAELDTIYCLGSIEMMGLTGAMPE